MSARAGKPPPNTAPVYAAAMYKDLAVVAMTHGYALAVHGSLARDFDLIAIPWIDGASEPAAVIDDLLSQFAIRLIGKPATKPHGRIAYTLSVGFGDCAIDLSFTPRAKVRRPPLVKR